MNAAGTALNLHRLAQSTPALDCLESEWWARFAQLEREITWAQTPCEQRFLRGRYISRMVARIDATRPVVDLGCGSGWLALMLAEAGAKRVAGLDFSPEQVALARAAAMAHPAGDRVQFSLCCSGADLKDAAPEGTGAVVIHAFLHHLAEAEIKGVLREVAELLPPGGVLLMVEPTLDPRLKGGWSDALWHWVAHFPLRVLFALRGLLGPPGEVEQGLRREMGARMFAEAPRGFSPKEIPFYPDELEGYLNEAFRIEGSVPVLAFSHHWAAELLLMERTSPRLAGWIRLPVLWLARALESAFLKCCGRSSRLWVFRLWIARKGTAVKNFELVPD